MVIHAGVVVVWVALFLLAFGQGGVFAWSVGLAYLVYDTVLQVFTGWQIRRITAARAAPQDTARSTLAVIVAAYNEADRTACDVGRPARPGRSTRRDPHRR